MITAACVKWVDRRPETDTLVGAAGAPDERFAGVSAADQAALEWALRCREHLGGEVVAVTVGPPGADAVLRDALAAGADRAIRVELPFDSPSHSVAGALADVLGEATSIWCGDYSFDRGTGSVPAYLADELGIAQALGLVAIEVGAGETKPAEVSATESTPAENSAGRTIGALRRLDGGRRERLLITGRAVFSVEGSTALLRRAPLRRMLARPAIHVVPGPTEQPHGHLPESRPYRPRPRAFAPPHGETALDRVKALTMAGSAGAAAHGETVTLDPEAAADRILVALREWGYLP